MRVCADLAVIHRELHLIRAQLAEARSGYVSSYNHIFAVSPDRIKWLTTRGMSAAQQILNGG